MNEALEKYFELAFMAEQVMPENKSSFAAFLYQWLELIESSKEFFTKANKEVFGDSIDFGRDIYSLEEALQIQRVTTALNSKDLSEAKTLVKSIGTTALQVLRETIAYDVQFIPTSFSTHAMVGKDIKGKVVFRFKLLSKKADVNTVTGVIFLNLISILRLEPRRFQKCPKCGKFFYQYQRKNQKYCSRVCSETGRTGKMYKAPI